MPSPCCGRCSSVVSLGDASVWGRRRWTLVGLLALAWALRLSPMLDNRFHPDEALYGYWGLLIEQGRDPWLEGVPVYKPPLLPYVVAGTQLLFGDSEFTVRLPGLAAGLLTGPLAAALAHSLYRDRRASSVAAVGVILSPFAILFSVTAFPDPLMVVLGLGSCAAVARGRPGWAGLLAGLSLATKQTGLVWVPLALALSLIQGPKARPQITRFLLSLLLTVALVFAWDAARVAQGAESFWDTGVAGYGGLRLVWPQELWARLRSWVRLARYLFVSPVINGVLLVGLPSLARAALMRHCRSRECLTDLLLVSFCFVYFLTHWLWAFPIWDRYLLPLVPLLAILLGRLLSRFAAYLMDVTGPISGCAGRLLGVCHLSVAICLCYPAFNAANSRYPVGGDHGVYDGIDQVAAFLGDLPEGTVVYQHWLGWHLEYYLFHAPVYLAYWPTPAWLAEDVQAFGGRGPRYISFPSREMPARVLHALAGVGYGLERVLATVRRDGTPSFTVYRIVSLSAR